GAHCLSRAFWTVRGTVHPASLRAARPDKSAKGSLDAQASRPSDRPAPTSPTPEAPKELVYAARRTYLGARQHPIPAAIFDNFRIVRPQRPGVARRAIGSRSR